jgi:opacity protein-like surface antigen
MKPVLSTGLASAAVLLLAIGATPVLAADMYEGSLKDDPMPVSMARGGCYLRGDVGYGWSGDSDASYVGNTDNTGASYESFDSTDLSGAAFGEFGLGCGQGVRGLRGDVMFGIHGDKDFDGHIPINTNPDDPIYTEFRTYTSMVNVYYDLGDWGGFVPYVGAGIGAALHEMDNVYSTDPTSPNAQFGDTKVDLAWSVGAGVGYQVSSGVMLDVGYRYLDLGDAHSANMDNVGAWNPMLQVHDITEHEIKAGIRINLD